MHFVILWDVHPRGSSDGFRNIGNDMADVLERFSRSSFAAIGCLEMVRDYSLMVGSPNAFCIPADLSGSS